MSGFQCYSSGARHRDGSRAGGGHLNCIFSSVQRFLHIISNPVPVLHRVLKEEIMVEIESQQNRQAEHDDCRADPEFRMQEDKGNGKQFYKDNHYKNDQMHQPLMLKPSDLLFVLLQERRGRLLTGDSFFMLPAPLFHIDAELI